MALYPCNVNLKWTLLGEITTSTAESSSSIDLSQIPSSANEILVEMGWFYNNGHHYTQSYTVTVNGLPNNLIWNFSNTNGNAGFVFYCTGTDAGKISQFDSTFSTLTTVFARVYYR